MNKEIKLTEKCPDCQVSIGEHHEDGCDTSQCRFTGTQQLMCGFSFGGFLPNGGIDLVETNDHECEPTVWTGEWPGVKVCRENNWYAPVNGLRGEVIIMEDLNSVALRANWNPEIEDWEAK